MAQILVRNIDPEIHTAFVKKAESLGLSAEAFARHVFKEAVKNTRKEDQLDALKIAKAQVTALAEALGRTQGASPEQVEKLKKTLIKIFEQEVQS